MRSVPVRALLILAAVLVLLTIAALFLSHMGGGHGITTLF